jgi:peptidoglycan/LPS O-acetylase OafA/YrhL
MAERELFIDRLRSVLTACVILHHCAITYGASGGWFYYERHFDGTPSSLLLTVFTGTQQAYFMGFFFLLSGYFTASSLDRKGAGRFLADRFLRLGLPLLGFILLLGPLTAAIVEGATGGSFWGTFAWLWHHQRIINGPLWFAQALLIFSLLFCGWRAVVPAATTRPKQEKIPGFFWWMASAVAVGAGSLLIRQWVPVGKNVFGLQLGFFSSYVFLFFLGIVARRRDWIAQLTWKQARWPFVVSMAAFPLLWVTCGLFQAAHPQQALHLEGGLNFPAMVYAFWEPLFAWGVIAALLVGFRRWLNRPSPLWNWLDRRAYAVYVIHPLVLVGMALLLHGWTAAPVVKFGVVGGLACVCCWLLADPLVRLPGLRRIL